MKKLILAVSLCLFSTIAFSQVCAGPGPCVPTEPVIPTELCIRDVCTPINYNQLDKIVIANSNINGYAIIGWAGPCLKETIQQCPDIFNQAVSDLYINATRALRAVEF